jgi:PAS domain S-box-containing protein
MLSLELLELIGTALGAVLALAAMGRLLVATARWLKPRIRTVFKSLVEFDSIESRLGDLTKTNEKLERGIETLLAELKPNGGASLRDQMNRIELNLELNIERLRASKRDSDELVFEADADGKVIWANRTVLRVLNRTPEQVLGAGWVNIIPPRFREKVVERWDDSIREEREFEMEVIWTKPDSTEFPVFVHSYRMVDSKGRTLGYYGTVKLLDGIPA